jgi:hypothetical protein
MRDTSRLREGVFGVMCHYLFDQPGGSGRLDYQDAESGAPGSEANQEAIARWNRQVDAVDVDALVWCPAISRS